MNRAQVSERARLGTGWPVRCSDFMRALSSLASSVGMLIVRRAAADSIFHVQQSPILLAGKPDQDRTSGTISGGPDQEGVKIQAVKGGQYSPGDNTYPTDSQATESQNDAG